MNKQKYEKIREKKQSTAIDLPCEASQVRDLIFRPPLRRLIQVSFLEEFAIYMNYFRKLGFEEVPDYGFLRIFFR